MLVLWQDLKDYIHCKNLQGPWLGMIQLIVLTTLTSRTVSKQTIAHVA